MTKYSVVFALALALSGCAETQTEEKQPVAKETTSKANQLACNAPSRIKLASDRRACLSKIGAVMNKDVFVPLLNFDVTGKLPTNEATNIADGLRICQILKDQYELSLFENPKYKKILFRLRYASAAKSIAPGVKLTSLNYTVLADRNCKRAPT